MLSRSIQKLYLLLLIALSASAFADVNLITNGGFETGNTSGWTFDGVTNWTSVVNGGAYEGNYSLRTGPDPCCGNLHQTISTSTGANYLLSFYYKNRSSSTPTSFEVKFNGTSLLNITNGPSSNWTNYSYNVRATSASSDISFLFFNNPDYMDLDNVSFTLAAPAGPSAPDTQASLKTLASRLRGSYNGLSAIANFPNSNTYDCNLFDLKGMCISAGGRYSTVDNPSSNSSAAVVTLGYKVSPSIRIGGFLDQSVNNNTPSGVHLSNSNPMMGAFLYWNQNPDTLGYQVKIANAYQDKDLSTTRDVIGTSEAGTGKTSLTTQSYIGELSYAFMFKENTLVRPYFALRHTHIKQDGYTETGLDNPLTYASVKDRTTSALMGVKFKHAITEKTKLTGSLGLEQDLYHKIDNLSVSGVDGLTSENLSGSLHRTRPVASLGATYDIAKTQRLSAEVLVQQLPFQSTTGATAYFNYMIGF